MKTFVNVGHPPITQAKQISQDGTGKRLYQTPEGNVYPSITTVLSLVKEEIITKWRNRVGNEVADFESNWGKDRGSLLHDAIERVLKNQKITKDPLLIQMLVQDLGQYLRKIDNIHCQEQALYSDAFQIAGRCDTIAEYAGILSIIDFKGSKKPKKTDWITDYFMQTSFYAYAYYERTGIKIPQCVILIATEQGHPQEFIVSPKDWLGKVKEVRHDYRKREGI